MNLKRGYLSLKTHNIEEFNPTNQDSYIRMRINKLFFMRKLEHLKK